MTPTYLEEILDAMLHQREVFHITLYPTDDGGGLDATIRRVTISGIQATGRILIEPDNVCGTDVGIEDCFVDPTLAKHALVERITALKFDE